METTLKDETIKVVLKNVELTAEELVNRTFNPAVELVKEKVKDLIPGEIADHIAIMVIEKIAPEIKAIILANIEKISKEV